MEKKSSGWLKFTISVKLSIKLQTRVHFIVFQGYSKVKLEGACKKTDHFFQLCLVMFLAGQAYKQSQCYKWRKVGTHKQRKKSQHLQEKS